MRIVAQNPVKMTIDYNFSDFRIFSELFSGFLTVSSS